jgi:hypothetical protein
MRLRPHHILCVQFLPEGDMGRGHEYRNMETKLKDVISLNDDTCIEVTEGVDELCGACPECAGGRCNNTFGDENSVRKWDARVIEGLGITYGEVIRTRDLHTLILSKAPLTFCKERCPWRSACTVFEENRGEEGRDL